MSRSVFVTRRHQSAVLGRSAAGDIGDDDVGGVAVEVLSPPVVDGGGPGVGVAGGDLDVSERYAGVEGGHDEPGPEHVRMDQAQPGSFPDRPHPTMSRTAIEAAAVMAEQDRSLVPFPDGGVNRTADPRYERDRG